MTQLVLQGARGSRHVGKRTFTNVIFDVLISQIRTLFEGTQPKRPRWVYCILLQYIMAWANSSCLS